MPAPFNNDPKDENVLAGDLLGAFSLTLVQLYVFDVPLRVKVDPMPRANALARLQASQGWVTSQFHMCVGVDEFAKNLLPLLDGTRNLKALYADMFEIARKGKLNMVGDSASLLDESALRKAIQKSVDDALVKFGRAALLV